MEQSFSALMDRTMFSCKWLDRLERMGRSLFFRLQTNNGMGANTKIQSVHAHEYRIRYRR